MELFKLNPCLKAGLQQAGIRDFVNKQLLNCVLIFRPDGTLETYILFAIDISSRWDFRNLTYYLLLIYRPDGTLEI